MNNSPNPFRPADVRNLLPAETKAAPLVRAMGDVAQHAAKAAARRTIDDLPEKHLLRRLARDHREFAKTLAGLVREATRLRAAGDDDHDILCSILDAARHLRTFADHCRQEDELLMPELARRGFKDMPDLWRNEHTDLAGGVENLLRDARLALDGSEDAKAAVVRVFDGLVLRITEHIAIEEDVVFPVALAEIDEATWATLAYRAAGWSEVEQAHGIF